MASNALVASTGGGRRPVATVRGGTAMSVASATGGRPSLTATVASRPTTGRGQGSARTAAAAAAARPPQVLTCNRCTRPLATTCYLTRCDCIFCEECTFAHFAASSTCPRCSRTLGEADFTELVVSGGGGANGDGSGGSGGGGAGSTAELTKASMQALFSNQHPTTGHLPHSDLCRALLKQFDVVRTSTKFVLKQMIVESTQQGNARLAMARQNRRYQAQTVQMKKEYNALKLGHERQKKDFLQRDTAHQKRVAELQAQIKERDDRIAQFEAMIGSRVPGGGSRGGGGRSSNGHNGIPAAGMMPQPASHSHLHHNVPPHSTSTGGTAGSTGGMGGGGGTGGRSSLGSSRMGTGRPTNGGVIQGFITNQQQAAREQDLALRQRHNPIASAQGRRAGSLGGMPGPMGAAGGGGGMMPAPPMRLSIGGGGMTQQQVQHAQMRMMQAQQPQQFQMQQQQQLHHQQHQMQQQQHRSSRPSSNLSLTGVEPPPTPGNRIRDMTNMPYQFTSGSSSMQDSFGGGGGGRANKRRRGTANSGHSRESFGLGMDQSTAGLLNAGPHTQRKY